MRIADRLGTALVTGARCGLGAAFARMLAAEGVRVWGTSRTVEGLAGRSSLRPLRLDLGDPASVDGAWAAAERDSGGIELLVNNAGAGVFGAFGAVPVEAWERQVEILFRAQARLAWLAWAAMRGRGRGCIVNVTSLAVEFPIPYMAGYNAAKAGLAGLTASLDLEARESGVSVIEFRAGDFRTEFNQAMAVDLDRSQMPPAGERVWRVLERNLAAAPDPAVAAEALRRALRRGRGGLVRSGSFFQARLAPLLARCATRRVALSFVRRYFQAD